MSATIINFKQARERTLKFSKTPAIDSESTLREVRQHFEALLASLSCKYRGKIKPG